LAGFPPGSVVTISTVSPSTPSPAFLRKATVGNDGGAVFDVSVPVNMGPLSSAFFTVSA
jgi:hypothetical protein